MIGRVAVVVIGWYVVKLRLYVRPGCGHSGILKLLRLLLSALFGVVCCMRKARYCLVEHKLAIALDQMVMIKAGK